MKLSIITPSNDTKYLKELEASIMANTYQNWEWIIVLNGKETLAGTRVKYADPRIKVLRYPLGLPKTVGDLKKYACNNATGDILVEVDHDDMITHDCLEELANAFKDDEIGFAYSDDAKLAKDFIPYDSSYGWLNRKFNWKGKDLTVMYGQPLYPGRLGYIWFAPDHVRAWRKSVYDAIGGHASGMINFCDDQELMHRTYLATKFKYIPKVLYIYRIDGNNNWSVNAEAIQIETRKVYNANIYPLAERFADISKALKIDLCGGFNKPLGYTSIDRFNGDITGDLNNGIPLPDNSCGVIRAHDALEHLKDKQFIMNEIHRVLIPGGMLLSSTPSTDGRGAFQDPTHVSYWNENSFWYYTRELHANFVNQRNMFRECALYTWYPNDWYKDNGISYVVAHLEKLPTVLPNK